MESNSKADKKAKWTFPMSKSKSGMPPCWNPTITLLQKKREGVIGNQPVVYLNPNGEEFKENCWEKAMKSDKSFFKKKATKTDKNEQKLTKRLQREKTEMCEKEFVVQGNSSIQNTHNCNGKTEVKEKMSSVECENSYKEQTRQFEPNIPDSNNPEPGNSRDPRLQQSSSQVSTCQENSNREQIINPDKHWFPAHASYRLKKYENRSMKIENYEPGMSSVVLQDQFAINFYNLPVDKPGEHCKYVEANPNVTYRIHKKSGTVSPSPSESSIHNLYKKVQKGGDIPLEGLGGPVPPRKAHSFRTRLQERRHSDVGLTNSKASRSRLSINIPEKQVNSRLSSSPLTGDHRYSISALLSEPVSGNNPQSHLLRDEIKATRKKEMELILAEAKQRRMIQEAEINHARRHSDYFKPNVKSPVALDRYDLDDEMFRRNFGSPNSMNRNTIKAKVLYTFRAQNTRELSLQKGDSVYIWRCLDKNWYEGEHHGAVGIFPVNYVEVVDVPSVAFDGSGGLGVYRTKFDFVAKNPFELSLRKGDVIEVKRHVDENWVEGCFGGKLGLIPRVYIEPVVNSCYSSPERGLMTSSTSFTDSPVLDSTDKLSSTSSVISSSLDLAIPTTTNTLSSRFSTMLSSGFGESTSNSFDIRPETIENNVAKYYPKQGDDITTSEFFSAENSLFESSSLSCSLQKRNGNDVVRETNRSERNLVTDDTKLLASDLNQFVILTTENRFGPQQHLKGSKEILPYKICQVLYAYQPQDKDELELLPGDIIQVTESFDDGWFVGISQRTNLYGTFPGNYVQKLRVQHIEHKTF